ARPLAVLLVAAWISACIQAAWWFGRLPFAGSPGHGPWFAAGVYAAVVAQLAWMFRRVGRFGFAAAVAYPVGLAFFLAVFTRSLLLVIVRREVRWKGRRVPTRAPRPARAPRSPA